MQKPPVHLRTCLPNRLATCMSFGDGPPRKMDPSLALSKSRRRKMHSCRFPRPEVQTGASLAAPPLPGYARSIDTSHHYDRYRSQKRASVILSDDFGAIICNYVRDVWIVNRARSFRHQQPPTFVISDSQIVWQMQCEVGRMRSRKFDFLEDPSVALHEDHAYLPRYTIWLRELTEATQKGAV